MLRRALIVWAAFAAFFAMPSILVAEAEVHWYWPHYLSSVEEASNRMNFLAPHFAPMEWDSTGFSLTWGYRLERVDVSKLGINLIFSKSGTAVTSQYFWGGLGGYEAPVATQYRDDIVTSIVYAETSHFDIWAFPKAKNYPATWCVAAVLKRNPRNSVICVPNEEDAHHLADALATLALASGTVPGESFDLPFGMSVTVSPAKEAKKHPEQRGCLVANLLLEGPPMMAGLKNGDILHAIDDKPCVGPESLRAAIAADVSGKPEGKVHLEIYRKGRLVSLDLDYPNANLGLNLERLKETSSVPAPASVPAANAAAAPSGSSPALHLGIIVRAVTETDVAPLHLSQARGILVVDVEKGSLADKMGFLPGDVILEVNHSEIGDQEIFVQNVRSGAVKEFKIWRKGQSLSLVVPQSL